MQWSLALLVFAGSMSVAAASGNVLDVCASGCSYSSVQAAINAIGTSLPASSASNPYSIEIKAGVLLSDVDITTNGKSYITFAGSGAGASIIRASLTWIQQHGTHALLDISGSTHITIHDLTIDALTNDDGSITANMSMSGLDVDNADQVVIANSEIRAITYGIVEFGNSADHLIQVFSSRIVGSLIAARAEQSTWEFFSSDVIADESLGLSHAAFISVHALTVALDTRVVAWSTRFYAESDNTTSDQVFGVLVDGNGSSATFKCVGCSLGADYGPSQGSSTTKVAAIQVGYAFRGQVDIIGSELSYETGPSLSAGEVAALRYQRSHPNGGGAIRVVSTSAVDRGGSGGTFRADVVAFLSGAQGSNTNQPSVRITASTLASYVSNSSVLPYADAGSAPPTTNSQSGTVQLGNGSFSVTLPVKLPSNQYRVVVTSSQEETIWVTDKKPEGFTIHSSNSYSSSSVDWLVSR